MFDLNSNRSEDPAKKKELQEKLLWKGIELLNQEGLSALTMRRLAEECDTSTHMIYTLFDGKKGLIESIYRNGTKYLLEQYEKVPRDLPPLERLKHYAQHYRNFAIDNAILYDVVHSSQTSDDLLQKDVEVYRIIRQVVEECIEEGLLGEFDPDAITRSLFAAAHGAISLEIAGFYKDQDIDPEDEYWESLVSTFNGYVEEDRVKLPA